MPYASRIIPFTMVVLLSGVGWANAQSTVVPVGNNRTVSRVIRLRTVEPKQAIADQPNEKLVEVSDPELIQFEEFQPEPPRSEVSPALQQDIVPQHVLAPQQAIIPETDWTVSIPETAPLESIPETDSPASVAIPTVSTISEPIHVLVNTPTEPEPVSSPQPTTLAERPSFEPSKLPPSIAASSTGPILKTRISAPGHVNLNQICGIDIQLKNEGPSVARQVRFIVTLPFHVSLQQASPQPVHVDGQTVEFLFAALASGEVETLRMEVIANEKLPIEITTQSVVNNKQQFAVSVRQPKLELELTGPDSTNIGQTIRHQVLVENTGDGIAKQVELQVNYPDELTPVKSSTAIDVPQLLPGKSAVIELDSRASQPGPTQLVVGTSALGIESAQASHQLLIYQPELEVAATGPKMNFLNREGIYMVKLTNSGQVDVSNVKLKLTVSPGMQVTTISREAEVDMDRGSLVWAFDRIRANSEEIVQLKTLGITEGQQVCNISVASNETRDKEMTLSTLVAARADLNVDLENQSGPVQVGFPAKFLVTVENKGSRDADDVVIHVELPEALQPANANSQSIQTVGRTITFHDAKIAPGQKRQFEFSAVGLVEGEHIVRSMLKTKGSQRQIITEGSVYVYEVNEARVSESLSPMINR